MVEPSSSAVITADSAGGEDNDDEVSSTSDTHSLKRASTVASAEEEAKKKRFIWPDSLHKDFIAAIFDVGLKHADAGTVLDSILREDPQVAGKVHPSGIQAQISKFLMLRDRSQKDYSSYYERSVEEAGRRQASGGAVFAGAGLMENERLAKTQKLLLLRKQLEVVSQTISVQTNFLHLVKTSMETQLRAQADIISLIGQLDPSHGASLRSNNSEQLSIVASLPPYALHDDVTHGPGTGLGAGLGAGPGAGLGSTAVGPSSRLELQIISEMRTHMDLHRQLLMRKEDQVSQFGGQAGGRPGGEGGGAAADVPRPTIKLETAAATEGQGGAGDGSSGGGSGDWIWDDENMDEHLFNFLSAIPSGTGLQG